MVTKDEVRRTLAGYDGWWSTVAVARETPRTARSPMIHRTEVYKVLRRLEADAEVEAHRSDGLVYWRRVRWLLRLRGSGS